MRTTIGLPTDLHHAVSSIAAHTRKSVNQTVAELIRRGLAQPRQGSAEVATSVVRTDQRTGMPLIRSPRPVSEKDVRAIEDE
jgi:hypothetical protein